MARPALDTVKLMWIDYREDGVETALRHLHPDVEFRSHEGELYHGHDGVRAFFAGFERRGAQFTAAPYTFEPIGEGVIVAGHRRIRSEGEPAADAEYVYFSHRVDGDLITRLGAWFTREEAERDAAALG